LIDRVLWAEQNLNHRFSDLALLQRALTHRSAAKDNNERLEFLGDALLNFIVARRLFTLYPEYAEGDLSRARAALVNKSVLAEIAREIELDTQLILGAGEVRSGGAQRSSALGDALEAVIGAILVDAGWPAAERAIEALFANRLESLPDASALKDAKTRLQEWLQGLGLELPRYAVESTHGGDHNQTFTVSCYVEGRGHALGSGSSRRAAEQEAAAAMLAMLTREFR
jgi:ribonuclease-3